MSKRVDVFIKGEGYAEFKFLTSEAKKWAVENDVENSLQSFGSEFCGRPIFLKDVRDGLYQIGLSLTTGKKLYSLLIKSGLTLESELNFKVV